MWQSKRYPLVALMAMAMLCVTSPRSTAADNSDNSKSTDSYSALTNYDPEKVYVTMRLGAWALSTSGDVGIRNIKTNADVSFEDLLKQTNFAAFPSIEASKGNWVVAFNGVYSNISDSERFTGPLGVRRGLDVSSNLGVADLGIGYTVVRSTVGNIPFTLTPGIGGRWTYIDLKLDPLNFRSRSASRNWFDPYVGVQAVIGLTPKLDWRNSATIGGFDVGSKLTWSAESMLEWHFSKRLALDLGYRALSWDYDLNNFKWDMTFQGPWVGIAVNW